MPNKSCRRQWPTKAEWARIEAIAHAMRIMEETDNLAHLLTTNATTKEIADSLALIHNKAKDTITILKTIKDIKPTEPIP